MAKKTPKPVPAPKPKVAPKKAAPAPPPPEIQVVRNCGACGAAKHIFLSKRDVTPCDLCGKIQWV